MMTRPFTRPAPLAMALALAFPAAPALAQAGAPARSDAAVQQQQVFNLAAQPLGQALSAWALQTRMQLIVQPGLVAGKNAPAVAGSLTPRQALERLLAGSGLESSFDGQSAVVHAAHGSHSGGPLPAVTVRAEAEADGSSAAGYRARRASTAGFAAQDTLDTPFSVTVLSSELLTNQKVDNISGLDRLDASITSSGASPAWYGSPMIRGLGLDNWSNFRYNGMVFINQQVTGLENKERVEVLKGLSALQGGFAAPGGLINYVTKRPAAAPVNDVHLSANQYGQAKAHADLSRRTDDGRLGLRVNAALEGERSYVREVKGNRRFISAAVDWRLTPDTLVQLDLEHETHDQTLQPVLRPNVNRGLPTNIDPRRFLGQPWASFPTESTVASAKVEHWLNERWSLVGDLHWMELNRDQDALALGNIQPNGDATLTQNVFANQRRQPTTLRAMVQGKFHTGSVGHELALGVQSYRFKRHESAGASRVLGTTSLYTPVAFADPGLAVGPARLTTEAQERSLFGQDVLSLGEAWKLHLGGRYATRQQTDYSSATGVQSGTPYDKSVFTPHIALVHKPRANLSVYAGYVEGLEQGGTAPLGTANANQQLKPRVSKQIELGVKADLSADLSASAALFRIHRTAEYTNTGNTYVQDGLQRNLGLEFSLTGRVSKEWTLVASAMLLDAELQRTGDRSTEGKQPMNTPRQRFTAVAEYAPAQLPGWTFAGNWSHSGKRQTNDANTGELAPAYNTFGLGTRYATRIAGTPATFRLNIDNLFNKRYWDIAQAFSLLPGAPRTVSAGVSLQF